MLTSLSFAVSFAERPDVTIVVDGNTLQNNNMQVILNGRTLLPIRDLVKAFGIPNDDEHIKFNEETRIVTINNGDTHIELTIDSDLALINGSTVKLDTYAIIYNDFTYVPARFVGEALNKKIGWDAYDNRVLIRDLSDYEYVKNIFDDSAGVMNNVKKLKASASIEMWQYGNMLTNAKTYVELDANTKQLYVASDGKFGNEVITSEVYVKGYDEYTVNNYGMWEKVQLEEEFYSILDYASEFTDVGIEDETVYDVIFIDDSKTSNEFYVLKNSVPYKGLLEGISTDAQYILDNGGLDKVKDLTFEKIIIIKFYTCSKFKKRNL